MYVLGEKCGTPAGYQRHGRRDEQPCAACTDARNADRRQRAAMERESRPKTPKPDTTAERFWAKVNGGDVDDCWLWTASLNTEGYGQISVGGRAGGMFGAHRVAWTLVRGEIPAGLHLDHLCRNRACVNPWHLDPVTVRENARRGVAGEVNRARLLAITHCPQGHAYDEQNTGVRPNGSRRCRACARAYAKRMYVPRRAAA